MSRVVPRTTFHSSPLIRRLAEFGLVDAKSDTAFAEKLGAWVHFTDAITLAEVHQEPIAADSDMPCEEGRAALGIAAQRLRSRLVDLIIKSCTADLEATFVPYRRRYESLQREMELGVQSLRSNARELLAKSSPRLKKLSELDAALEGILCEREGKLLASVPQLLKKRYEQLSLCEGEAWLTRFCQDMQTLLLAELDLRLQPTQGLIEALNEIEIEI